MRLTRRQIVRCLLHQTMQLIIDRHPSVINSFAPPGGDGGSLLHFVIHNTNHPELLERLLNASCRIAMPRDAKGRSPLQIAQQNSKWHSLQLLLDAVRRNRFSTTTEPMRVVSEAMGDISRKYPLEYLKFISVTCPCGTPHELDGRGRP
jgi:hypothetical protein